MHNKLIYMVLAVLCIMIGVVGLIIPIIPGLLFLMAAVFLLGKVSRRFKHWSDRQPLLRKIQAKLDRLGDVDWPSRIKVVLLLGVEMIATAIGQVFRLAGRLKRRLD